MITLYLMNQKGLRVLEAICARFGYGVVEQVIGSRDSALAADFYEDIRDYCERHTIPHFERGKDPGRRSLYALAVGWRWLIEPNNNLIVLHDSLLPRYRGFAPLVNALLNRDPFVGVTALHACSEFDAGPIVGQRQVAITYPIRIAEAIDLISPLYTELAVEVVSYIETGRPIPSIVQNESAATYSLWRDDYDYQIDWLKSAEEIAHFVRVVGWPYRGASAFLEHKRVRILDVECQTDVTIERRDAGKVLFLRQGFPVVVCGEGLLKVRQIVTDETGDSLLPFSRLRLRFTGRYSV